MTAIRDPGFAAPAEGVLPEADGPFPAPLASAWSSRTRSLMRTVSQVSDFLAPLIALCVVIVGANHRAMPHGFADFLEMRFTLKNLLVVGWFAGGWLILCFAAGLYHQAGLGSARREAIRIVLVAGTGAGIALVFPAFSNSGAFAYAELVPFWALTSLLMLTQRSAMRALVARSAQEIVIIGTGPRAASLYDALRRGVRGPVRVLGFVDDEHPGCVAPIRERRLGQLDDLERILMARPVDQVLITLPMRSRYAEVQATVEVCARAGVRAEYLADLFEHPRKQPRFEQGMLFATIALPVASEDYWKLLVKRLIDVAGATVGLIVLAPVMLAAALLIWLTSPGPVLFRQDRWGYRKRRFVMYKFRTMVRDAEQRLEALEALNEATGPVFKLRHDPRVTPVGLLLRRSSIDELPQLVNVLLGDMSLVGPRPLPARDVARFTEAALMRRFSVRPGITGLWQVSGRSELPFDEWVKLDLRYIDEWSLGLDLYILAKTIPVVLRCRGAA